MLIKLELNAKLFVLRWQTCALEGIDSGLESEELHPLLESPGPLSARTSGDACGIRPGDRRVIGEPVQVIVSQDSRGGFRQVLSIVGFAFAFLSPHEGSDRLRQQTSY